MDTVAIRIGPFADGGYPATLHRFEADRKAWSEPIAQGSLGELPKLKDLGDPAAVTAADAIVSTLLTLNAASPIFSKIGSHLYAYLTTSPVGQAWQALARAPLRTLLDLRDAPLRRLPWELLTRDDGPLFTDPEHPLLRGDITGELTPEPFLWPLRVLVVVGFPADDKHANQEVQEIENAFRPFRRMVEMEVLEGPSQEKLEYAFMTFRPHVFHFIGHGKADPGSGQPMLEIVEKTTNQPWPWQKAQINALFQRLTAKGVPRLVFLNACRSGELSPAEQMGNRLSLWSLAEVVQYRGVPAVVSMHADIRQDLAALFSRPLYEGLLKGTPLDEALALARNRVFAKEELRRDWGLAHLMASVLPDRVLVPHAPMFKMCDNGPCSTPEYERIRGTDEFLNIRDFVDRKEQRRLLCYGIRPIQPGDLPRRLLVIEGEVEVGKSALLHYALEVCHLRRWHVAYVDMKDGDTLDLFSLLDLIRCGRPTAKSPLSKSQLDPNAFVEFDDELRKIDARASGPGDFRKSREWRDQAYGVASRLLEYFHRGLVRQTLLPGPFSPNGAPLVIALDHLKIAGTDFDRHLVPGLIAPIARGEHPTGLAGAGGGAVPEIYVVIVLSEREKANYNLGPLGMGSARVPVDLFTREDFIDLAKEFCRHHTAPDANLIGIIELYARRKVQTSWGPTVLRKNVSDWI
jgi:hypothetical protein